MKQILILGAGQSAPYLIDYLLKHAETHDWFVTVGDMTVENAQKAVDNHPRGNAIAFDINDAAMRATQFKKADLVVNFLSPIFQHMIALECLNFGKSMVSASYENKKVKLLDRDAHRKGIIILNEMGLDPGIDHMSAMALIDRVKLEESANITKFISYGSGIPAPEINSNPLRYCITWNARNVVRAGEVGAQYMEDNKIKVLPYHQVFNRTWQVDIKNVGTLEAYPNRDSLGYRELFGLEKVNTMIRGTLRYPGWSETWHKVVRLGLPNDTMVIPELAEKSYRDFVQMFLPLHVSGSKLEQRVANYLQINPTGKIMENFRWLGLFSEDKIGGRVSTAADAMTQLLMQKLPLPENGRDMVILAHELEIEFEDNPHPQRLKSTMVEFGQPGGFTAIAKTVGLPAAIAVKLILTDQLPMTGCHIPTHPAIYTPVLEELRQNGISFEEEIVPAPE